MPTVLRRAVSILAIVSVAIGGCMSDFRRQDPHVPAATKGSKIIRVATFNMGDVRTEGLRQLDHPRLKAAAAIIQQLRPDVILLNEIAYDQAGAPGYVQEELPGLNGQRFAVDYLAVSQREGLEPITYSAFMAPVNTGTSSGYDLDNNGEAVAEPGCDDEGQAYGADCWGFGSFPGQYGMALLVREGITLLHDDIRTFQQFPWHQMPNALKPIDPDSGKPWYDDEEWKEFRLSSKSHWDVPVQTADGQTIHLLCSHPTPPVFDGPEDRNGCRNHDEIRFWADYLNGESYIVDDSGRAGGLSDDAQFVILGDLNSDPNEGEGIDFPVAKFLLSHASVLGDFVPKADRQGQTDFPGLDDDTAIWGMRADYVLPSTGMKIVDGGIHRSNQDQVSDHFLVWVDLDLTVP